MPVNYNLTYNFGEYQHSVKKFLDKISRNSIRYFSKQISEGKILRNNSTYENPKFKSEFNKMHSFIKNVEEYLYYYYSRDRGNFENIFNSIEKIEAISVLDDQDRGIYGITYPTNIILISPVLSGNRELTPEQRTRLYVAHELGHMVNKKWMAQVTQHLGKNNTLNPNQKQRIYDGFSLINEATTQDRAEDIAYFYAHKQRPSIKSYVDPRGMYNGEPYRTNYDFYGELQEPAIMFARTLRGIGKIDDDKKALTLLSKRALNPNFVNSIINEYQRDGQIINLYNEFQYLGILKNASYARFGYSERSFLSASKVALDNFKKIASSLRDYREPFEFEL